jgi:hypothetical protein
VAIRWFYASDSMVRPTDLQSVLMAEAYLLFYQRDAPYSEPPQRALAPAAAPNGNVLLHTESDRGAAAGVGAAPGHPEDGFAAESGLASVPAEPCARTAGESLLCSETGDASPEESSTPMPNDGSPGDDVDSAVARGGGGGAASSVGSAAAQPDPSDSADNRGEGGAGGDTVKTLLLVGAGTDDAEASIHGGQPR